ncbi:MAG: hypothetical protein Q8922_15555 [Bacteroidota bacterium]|nr:hypothetical protein [Bacteroidota bacterium]
MKSTIRHCLMVTIAALCSVSGVRAQIPRTISYQGTATSSGAAMTGQHLFTVALYASASGGTPLYQESQQVAVTNGTFDIAVGSVNPLPSTLAFDRPYYLGVSIDGSPELSRTALSSAPYALSSHVADLAKGLTPGASGVVTSVNEVSGALHLVGDSTTSISINGNVLTIHANVLTGSGIQSVISPDKTITVANQNGPTVLIGVADSAITTPKLANGAITPAKLAQAGATQGQIFKWEGSRWTIVDDSVDLGSASGILPVAHGGTGTNILASGQVLVGNGQSPVTTAILSAGTGISIIPNAGTITISNTAGITGWALTGNAGTNPPTNFLGTLDNKPFEIHVFNTDAPANGSKRVMRYEPNGVSANLIGGYQGNSVSSTVVGATIAGGGLNGFTNSVTDDVSFVGGGSLNQAGNGNGSTVDASHATVGGGGGNTASGTYASVLGGASNIAGGVAATVGGGSTNTASGDYASVAGGIGDSAAGSISTVAGGGGNRISPSSDFSAIGGGLYNRTTGQFSTIPGGDSLTLGAMSLGVNVPGNGAQSGILDLSSSNHLAYLGNMDLWLGNTDNSSRAIRFFAPSTSLNYPARFYSSFAASSQSATINYTLPTSQPSANQVLSATAVTGAGPYAVTLGWTNGGVGTDWNLTGNSGTTAGTNYVGTQDNQAFEIHVYEAAATSDGRGRVLRIEPISGAPNMILGNHTNAVSAGTYGATIAGGGGVYGAASYRNYADGAYSTISGGNNNTAGGGNGEATVAGGTSNNAQGYASVVSGGRSNWAQNIYASIGGGNGNRAGDWSAVPGGGYLQLGTKSFGYNADQPTSPLVDLSAFSHISFFGDVDLWIGNIDGASRAVRFYAPNTVENFSGSNYSAIKAGSQTSSISYILPTSQPSANQVLTASSISGTGPYNVALGWTSPTANNWSLSGNSGTTDGTNFLGTTDNIPFTLRVNNQQALRVQPSNNTGVASAIGGATDNTIASGDTASFIGFGQQNRIAASYATILGGAADTITTAGDFSGIIASYGSKVSNEVSVIAGGELNLIAADNSFIGGGYSDTITSSAFGGVAAGGNHNIVRGDDGAVIGGVNNTAYLNSFIGGGIAGLAGGTLHTGAAVIGGWDDTSYADNSVILGGQYGYIDVNSSNAAIITGVNNYVAAQNSTIAGGGYLRLTGSRSFGFHAGSSSTDSAFVSSSNTAFFGNVNLWLGNTNNTPSQLRWYSPQNGGVGFPAASTHYTSIAAGSQSNDISYTLPTAAPVASGNLLLASSALPSAMAWSTNLVWDNANSRLGINTNAPAHPLHSVYAGTTDEIAAAYGLASASTSNQAIGVWGRASNNSSSNTGTIGVLATGNGNAIAGNTNVALQVNDGELAVGRTTESPSVGTDVEPATGGTAYTQQGPSGIIEFSLGPSGDLHTAAPTASQVQDLGAVTINNRYCQTGSIVLTNVVAMIDDGAAPNPQDAAFIVNADNVAGGSFKIRIKMLPTVTSASNYSSNDKLRVGYMIVNKSR